MAVTDTASARARGVVFAEAVRSRFFWFLTLAFCLSALATTAIRVHFIPFLIDNGVDANTAAFASSFIGIMQVAGRVVFAPLDRRVSGRAMVSGVFILEAVGMGALLLGASVGFIGIFIVVFGAAYGANTLARVSILAEQFGSRNYGRISSVMAIFLTFAGTLAPFGASLLYDHFDSYRPMLWLVIVLALAAGLTAWRGLVTPKAVPESVV
jgi:MFS family permease